MHISANLRNQVSFLRDILKYFWHSFFLFVKFVNLCLIYIDFTKTFQVTKKLICSLNCLEGKITQAVKSKNKTLCLLRANLNGKKPEQERDVNNTGQHTIWCMKY